MYRPVVIDGIDYQIDEEGNIPKRRGQGFLRPTVDKDGYLRLYNKFVHRLVYETWVGPIPEGMTIDHEDTHKDHNHWSNLRTVTAERNAELGSARNWLVKAPDGVVHEVYNLKQFCRDHGLHQGHLHVVLGGKNPSYLSHKGWRKP